MDSSKHLCGVYRGVCKDNVDPESRNRIRVTIPAVYGEHEVCQYWVWPCLVPGWRGYSATVIESPKVNEGVWIAFEGGDESKPVWMGTL